MSAQCHCRQVLSVRLGPAAAICRSPGGSPGRPAAATALPAGRAGLLGRLWPTPPAGHLLRPSAGSDAGLAGAAGPLRGAGSSRSGHAGGGPGAAPTPQLLLPPAAAARKAAAPAHPGGRHRNYSCRRRPTGDARAARPAAVHPGSAGDALPGLAAAQTAGGRLAAAVAGSQLLGSGGGSIQQCRGANHERSRGRLSQATDTSDGQRPVCGLKRSHIHMYICMIAGFTSRGEENSLTGHSRHGLCFLWVKNDGCLRSHECVRCQ